MVERLLQWAWNQRILLSKGSQTETSIKVLYAGDWNQDAPGPDFQNAILEFDGLTWYGSIEIHIKASDWYRHKHHTDPNYHNVILHVVAYNDKPVYIEGIPITTYEITPKILACLALMKEQTSKSLPCSFMQQTFSNSILKEHWIRRMHRKKIENGPFIQTILYLLGYSTTYAQIPWKSRQRDHRTFAKILSKLKEEIHQKAPYTWLDILQLLKSTSLTPFEYQQLVMNGLIPWAIDAVNTEDLILISQSLSTENNRITQKFRATGNNPKNAFESHAIMEIYRQLCMKSACLTCERGRKIFHP
ncbi:MAG: hypothetical protein RL432_611 [Bacteroidota bacterium]